MILRAYEHPFRRDIAFEVSCMCKRLGLKLLIAGDALLAKKAKACGLHLNKKNFSLLRKWKFLEKTWIITASSHSIKENFKIFFANISASIYSPVFHTKTHPDARPIGYKKFALALKKMPKKAVVYAMGGLNKRNIKILHSIANCPIAAISLHQGAI